MISTYLNSLVRNQLMIEEVSEPEPWPKLRARQLAAQPDAGPLPMFLVVCCRKCRAELWDAARLGDD